MGPPIHPHSLPCVESMPADVGLRHSPVRPFQRVSLSLLLAIGNAGCGGRTIPTSGATLVGAQLEGRPRAFEGLDVSAFDLLDVLEPSEAVGQYFPGRNPEAWEAHDGSLSVEGELLKLVESGPDPQFVMRAPANSHEVCQVEVEMSSRTAGELEMFWTGRDGNFSPARRLAVPMRKDPEGSSTAVFKMDQPEPIGRLRFDPPGGQSTGLRRVVLKGCRLRPSESWLPLTRQPRLVSIHGDARSSLVIPPGLRHSWLMAPPPGTIVTLSVASSSPQDPAAVVVRSRSLDGRRTYFETVLETTPGTWRDYRLALELPPAAGRVALSFEMAGGKGIGYLANPVLSGPQSKPTRPDIVLISLDTSAAHHFSLYGYPRKTSPHLDAHAQRGLLFSNAFSAAAYTLPSHASMLSGLSPLQTHAMRAPVPSEVPLVAQLLSKGGYETIAVTGGPMMSADWGFSKGFDRFADRLTTSLRRQTDEVLDALSHAGSAPVFVFLHSYAVHSPYRRTGAFSSPECGRIGDRLAIVEASSDTGSPSYRIWWLPPGSSTSPIRGCVADLYDEGIQAADAELGRLLTVIAKRTRPTAVIFTSDHGEMLGEGGRFLHGWDSEQVARVPLAIWGPGVRPGVTSAMACGYDVAPTLLGFAGIAKPASMRGVDLLDRSRPETRSCLSFALFPRPTLTLWKEGVRTALPLIAPRPVGDARTSDSALLEREVDDAFRGRQLLLHAGTRSLHVSVTMTPGFMVCLTPECDGLGPGGRQGDFNLGPGMRSSLGLLAGWTGRMNLVIGGHPVLIDLGQPQDRGFSLDGKTVMLGKGQESNPVAVRLVWPGMQAARGPSSVMTEQVKALGYIR